MATEIGSILDGKITGLTRYGAFVQLSDNGVGMVHISEVSYQFINDISEHLAVGQEVKVKVITIDENGRIGLSIKKALPPPPRQQRQPYQQSNNQNQSTATRPQRAIYQQNKSENINTEKTGDQLFEDKLKQFMQTSDNKISDLKHYTDRKTGSRRGRK